ncbi:MAG: phosphodiester glycosidase family protein [Vallitalea sp.]|jgi:hypothetical protein|nr:phosphodiester glycosidase family protein [Vallitalea sp.]
MKGIMKKAFSLLIAIGLIYNSNISVGSTIDNILYESNNEETISSGITYKKNTRLTEAGWLDIHVIEADLTNPYVKMDIIRNTDGFGIKDTLTSIATKNKVIAGVNGDFFNMKKNPTDISGLEYEKDGIFIAKNFLNGGSNNYGSFMIDSDNRPLIDYIKIDRIITSEDGTKFYVYGMNQVTFLEHPIYFDKYSLKDTKELDEINQGLCKMVVENDIITYLSALGENVEMPENGYVVVMPEEIASYIYKSFPVGTKVTYHLNTNIDMDSINMAISGGGKIISEGKLISEGFVVQGNKRHPRTAIGYNEDKSKVYMVVVDGRGSSIGVTHEELGNILLDNGLYDAIHLDGGGSSTLVARQLGNSNVKVYNRPSGIVQRKIANGIGVTSTAPIDDLYEIKIVADKTRVFKDMPIKLNVIGYDKNFNPVSIDKSSLFWQTIGLNGKWDGNTFYPINEGKGTIKANINGISASLDIECMSKPISLEINNKYSFLEPGESTEFRILGIDKNGYRGEVNVKNIRWEVENDNIGAFYDGKFVASDNLGYSLIKGTIGETTVYGYVIVNQEKNLIDSFENDDAKIHSVVSSDTVQGTAEVIKSPYEGNNSIKLGYSFKQSSETQAAYIEFDNPYIFEQKLNKLGLWVDGDGHNYWLRGRIKDADGKDKLITFSHEVDWTGWKYVYADIPRDISYPIKLDRIYIASLNCLEDENSELKFDNLTAHNAFSTSDLILPKEKIYDPLHKVEINEPQMKISVFGNTSSKNSLLDDIIQRKVLKKMDEISDVSLFVGDTEIKNEQIKNEAVIWNDKYNIVDYDNVRIINLATSKNGMRLTDPNQWKKFTNDLYNTKQKHLIINMDNNPLDKQGFTDRREGELFHSIVKKFKEENDKNVFVINGSGYDFNIQYIEGIRYMDINGLWHKYQNKKVDLNDKFHIINFDVNAENISYKVIDVYPKIIIE